MNTVPSKYSRSFIGRADLCTLMSLADDEKERDVYCKILGFKEVYSKRHITSKKKTTRDISLPRFSTTELKENAQSIQSVTDTSKKKLTYYHITTYEQIDTDKESTIAPDWFLKAARLNKKDFYVQQSECPRVPPLVPWSRLWPILRKYLSNLCLSNRIDVDKLSERFARCEPCNGIPHELRNCWLPQVHVLCDKREALHPFFSDMNQVAKGFMKICKKSSLKIHDFMWGIPDGRYLDDNNLLRTYHPPSSNAAILCISDMGFLSDNQRIISEWESLGGKLADRGLKLTALTPCPPYKWRASVCRWWDMLYWDVNHRPGTSSNERKKAPIYQMENYDLPENKRMGLQKMLHLFSPVLQLEPGMIRKLRTVLPGSITDAGTEYELWRMRNCLPGYREHFSKEDITLREKVVGLITRYHASFYEIVNSELKTIQCLAPDDMYEFTEEQRERTIKIKDFDARMAKTVYDLERTDLDKDRFLEWFRNDEKLMPPEVWSDKYMALMWALFHRDDKNIRLPQNINMKAIRWVFHEEASFPVRWYLYQNNTDIVSVTECNESLKFPLGSFETINTIGMITIKKDGIDDTTPLIPGAALHGILSQDDSISDIRISSFIESIHLKTITRPDWAEEIGRDEHGLYVDIVIKDVRQRMRWINPGKFMMGSPESEEGRRDNEKQHEVILTKGYWLFDTPVTQALWKAVMKENPSEFKSPDRPVENVSWEDCDDFIKNINELIPELHLRLPTESQWEYAGRAGSETATYVGDLEILGEYNAPILDTISWYGGNSGNDFELEKGYDSSKWEEKQYNHTKAGTHPVKKKRPNQWGLYDMIGNVLEWCDDYYGDYPQDLVTDPRGPESGGSRVLRGGSWDYFARSCRSAYRCYHDPGDRDDDVGFRLSRGLENEEILNEEVRRGGQTKRPEALTEILTYKWHRRSGQDEYGWWFEFGYKETLQRMRWIEPGKFVMGSPETEPERDDDETQHTVVLTQGYWLADTACTQALWKVVMRDNPSNFKGDDRPVENVSWEDCQRFLTTINNLSELPDISLCLPTEAQWEYACRAETLTPFYYGENTTPDQVNYNGNYPYAGGKKGEFRGQTVDVKSFTPNKWGLYQMHGNVREWCNDWFGDYPDVSVSDPQGPDSGGHRVLRGGSWFNGARYCRSAYRNGSDPGNRYDFIGFRLSRGQQVKSGSDREKGSARGGQPEGSEGGQIRRGGRKIFDIFSKRKKN